MRKILETKINEKKRFGYVEYKTGKRKPGKLYFLLNDYETGMPTCRDRCPFFDRCHLGFVPYKTPICLDILKEIRPPEYGKLQASGFYPIRKNKLSGI